VHVLPSVVVVDDDEAIRETLRLVLEDAGYPVEDVEDGRPALGLLRENDAPTVVLLDLIMMGMDGDAVLREVVKDEQLRRHCYVLMTAAHKRLTPSLMELLRSLDAPVLPKPFDLDTLLTLVAATAERVAGQRRG
jgi:CheY-like chemotaxis protein